MSVVIDRLNPDLLKIAHNHGNTNRIASFYLSPLSNMHAFEVPHDSPAYRSHVHLALTPFGHIRFRSSPIVPDDATHCFGFPSLTQIYD